MSLAAILFLKNENKFVYNSDSELCPSITMLEQQLQFLESFVDAVYILDDKSTDGSQEIYKKYHERGLIKYWETTGSEFNEQQYCARLLEFVKFNNHEWMLYLDGDEVLDDSSRYWINNFINKPHAYDCRITVRFNYINLWRSRKRYRSDKWYFGDAGKLFHVTKDLTSYGEAFNNHFYAYPDIDDSNKISFGNIIVPGIKILHYAWVDWNHQIRKVEKNIKWEIECNNKTLEEAKVIYECVLDEEGIVLVDVDYKWQREYIDGIICYESLK
jgi:hypothetical protein